VKKIATMAETYDIGVAPHCPLGPIAFAACLQIGFSTPNFVIQEMSWKMHYNLRSEHDLYTYLVDSSVFKIRQGMIEILEGPGLGIEVDEALIRDEDREFREGNVEAWRNPVCK